MTVQVVELDVVITLFADYVSNLISNFIFWYLYTFFKYCILKLMN